MIIEPMHAICIIGEQADRVYFNLNGSIAITRNRTMKLSMSKTPKIFSFLPPGSSFGELGVIYNINR